MDRNFNINRRELKTEINIIPLLDVLLVLLLVLIISNTMVFQKIEVDLPNTKNFNKISTINNPTVIFEIKNIGQYKIIINDNFVKKIVFEDIISEVQHLLLLNSKTVFLIASTKNIPYFEIVNLLNILHISGVENIGLITHSI